MSKPDTTKPIVYPLEITVLSPLFIGTQDTLELSPYTDYYVEGDRVYYVDQDKLLNAVAEAGKLDEYINIVGTIENNRAKESIGRFIDTQLGGEDFSAHSQQQFGLDSRLRLPIAPTISTAVPHGEADNGPKTPCAYVPGSSLKGALRTTILYHWLTDENGPGSEVLRRSFSQIERLTETNRRKRGLRRNDYRRRREIQREENRILRDILPEEKLFGTITNSDARRIRVRDCTPVKQNQVGVYLAQRHRLIPHRGRYKRQESSIPQPRQAILPDTRFVGELNVLPDLQNPALRYLVQKPTLVKAVNQLADHCIDNELYQLDMAKSEGSDRLIIDSLTDFYEHTLMPALEEPDTVVLRLGGGKTVFDNSLLLALVYGDKKEKEEERYFRILREALFGIREDHDLFPVTRTLGPGGEAFGWVKIKVGDGK